MSRRDASWLDDILQAIEAIDGYLATVLRDRIAVDPAVAFGRPVVAGTRIAVSHVLRLAGGMSPKELLGEYPHLVRDDVQACLAFGAHLAGRPLGEPA